MSDDARHITGNPNDLPTDPPSGGEDAAGHEMGTAKEQSEMPTVPPGQFPRSADLSAKSLAGREFGDYLLIEELARGGMGIVFKAEQRSLRRIVALKMILEGRLATQLEIDRFRIEAQSAAHLDHPGIVPIFETGEHEGKHYFSMAFIDGQSLEGRLAAGPLPEIEAAQLLRKITEAIGYAHQRGVIHRDLKPANILIDRDGSPRITDFGLARQTERQAQLTVSGQIMGTPSYMSPEQAGGHTDIGQSTDIYALGAILFAMLTGKPPFQGNTVVDTITQVLEREPESPRSLNPQVSRDLETICLKCLEKNPQERYQSAEELADELQRFLNDEPISARPLSRLGKLLRWRRIIKRNRDVRLRSTTTIMGLPLIDVALGRDTEKGETSGHARGIVAIGDRATGLIAIGGTTRGLLFSCGQYSMGLVAVGGCSVGVVSAGFFSAGLLATGAIAIGALTFGGVAIGWLAMGLVAAGVKAWGAWAWQLFG